MVGILAGDACARRKKCISGFQIIPFRSSRKVSINNYYYLAQVCHFGMVSFGKAKSWKARKLGGWKAHNYPQITQISAD